MRRVIAVMALLATGALLSDVAGRQDQQQGPHTVKMSTLDFTIGIFMLTAGDTNSIVLPRDDGVVLVDPKPGWGQAMLDAIKLVTDKPVTTIINTHANADPAGNAEFPTVKQIVGHEQTKSNMQKLAASKGTPARFVVNEVVTDRISLFEGPDGVDVYYFGAGHTNGDLVVVFPGARIMHMGNLFPMKAVPNIDTGHGGSFVALPQTLARVASEIKNVNRVTMGRNPGRADLRDLQEYADFNRDLLDIVRNAMKEGKSADEASGSLVLPERYKNYDLRQAKASVAAMYDELKR